jgi:hypothetical protein
MSLSSDVERRSWCLVDVIDLKWLLAYEGIRLHVERLQSDVGYADAVLALASQSPTLALRAAAARLRGTLDILS